MAFIKGWPRRLFFSLKETIGGTFAITTTNFIELNVKRGQQFYFSEKYTGFTAGSTKEYLFQVATDSILKARIIKTNVTDVDYEVIINDGSITVTDPGTPITIQNANGLSSKTISSSVFEDPVYTGGPGILNERDWIPGEAGIGNRSIGSFEVNGFEKIIPAGSEIITRFTNNGTADGALFYYLTVYEGPIVPLNDEEVIPTK